MKNKVEATEEPRVEFTSEVLQQIRVHARSSMKEEICGVLIGEAKDGVTRVTARIAGEGATRGGAHVTFTQDTWEHIFKIKDAEFPALAIVGWYHSHPGFGIFLSDYDIFIHENFFNAPHQVAWVFDPHSDEEGCFGWKGGKVEPLARVTTIRQHRAPAPEQAEKEASSRGKSEPEKAPKVEPAPKKTEKPASIFYDLGLLVMVVILMALSFEGGSLWRHLHEATDEAGGAQTSQTPRQR